MIHKGSSLAFLAALLILCYPSRATLSEASSLGFSKSYAVVIGINKYPSDRWGDLGYAVRDAKAVAEVLAKQGFEVELLIDQEATRLNILSLLEDHLGRQLGEGDRVIVFFAGHGWTEELGEQEWGYVVPYDGGGSLASLISMETIRTLSEKMGRARHQLYIMDACYGGHLISRGGHVVSKAHPNYVAEVARRPARQIITAGGKDQRVQDNGPNGHSVFTAALLEGIDGGLGDLDGDGFIVLPELEAFMATRATTSLQAPVFGSLAGHGGGEFIFSVGRASARAGKSPADGSLDRTRGTPEEAAGFYGVGWATVLVAVLLEDETEWPLPGVMVHFRGDLAAVAEVSNPDGLASVTLPPGRYRVTANLEGFAPVEINSFEVAAGQETAIGLHLEIGQAPVIIDDVIEPESLEHCQIELCY